MVDSLSNVIDIKYDFCEFQIILKLDSDLPTLEKKVLDLGAKRIGTISEEEEFWVNKHSDLNAPERYMMIRSEDSKRYLSLITNAKSEENNLYYQRIQNKLIKNDDEMERCLKNCEQVAKFHKRRMIFMKNNVQINLERISIPQLGVFINFTFSSVEDLKKIAEFTKLFDLTISSTVKYGYYKYITKRMTRLNKLYHYFYDLLGSTVFGVSASILSILGLMIGVYAALSTSIAIITSIMSLAFADSLADTYALYNQKKIQGFSQIKSLKFAFSNFISRFFLTSSFIIPFVFFDKVISIIINLVFGFVILIILNLIISFYQEENKIKSLLKSLTFSVGVLFGSYFAGILINNLFG